jgi:hypothetical protein
MRAVQERTGLFVGCMHYSKRCDQKKVALIMCPVLSGYGTVCLSQAVVTAQSFKIGRTFIGTFFDYRDPGNNRLQ